MWGGQPSQVHPWAAARPASPVPRWATHGGGRAEREPSRACPRWPIGPGGSAGPFFGQVSDELFVLRHDGTKWCSLCAFFCREEGDWTIVLRLSTVLRNALVQSSLPRGLVDLCPKPFDLGSLG